MTNKEFFLKTLETEEGTVMRVLKAVPADNLNFKPHEKARAAGDIAFQLAYQPIFMNSVAMKGAPEWDGYKKPEVFKLDEIIASAEKNYAEFKKNIASLSDEEWEKGNAVLTFPGGEWKTERYDMVWSFLFDLIHHRGQLTTYIRIMGGKVPSIYGGSADEQPGA